MRGDAIRLRAIEELLTCLQSLPGRQLAPVAKR
jgi:hemolysin activation/secretion protein